MTAPGWYRDPSGAADGRYWDGQSWTDQVNSGGASLTLPMEPAKAQVPPAPGTEYVAAASSAPAAPTVVTSSSGGGGHIFGTVLATLAVILAVIALVVALTKDSTDSDENPQTEPTAEPAEPAAPAESGE